MKAAQRKPKTQRKREFGEKSLEKLYRTLFPVPAQQPPARGRLSRYKSVPSVTTYGVYDRPL